MESLRLNGVPANLDAEKALLGAILIDNEAMGELVGLNPGDFYGTAHQHIFREAQQLATSATPINPLTLRDALQQSGSMEEVGGPAYIASLTDGVPRSSNVSQYADIVKRHARNRRLASAASRLFVSACGQWQSYGKRAPGID